MSRGGRRSRMRADARADPGHGRRGRGPAHAARTTRPRDRVRTALRDGRPHGRRREPRAHRLASDAGAAVEAHWSLNALNALAVEQLAELGAGLVWLSPELSGRQIAEVCSATRVPLGVSVWGRQEVMVTEHCVLMAEGECDRRCGTCARRASARMLRDRKGYEFPVQTDVSGRTHVFNSVRLDLTTALPEIIGAGVAALRLDVQTESRSRCGRGGRGACARPATQWWRDAPFPRSRGTARPPATSSEG